MFNKWKSLFNKVMTEQQDTKLRETYPANVESSTEFNEFSEIDIEDLDRLINDPQTVGWASTSEQILLFTLLTAYYDQSESILDVGCGRGDLFGFIQEKYNTTSIDYTGVDYNPNITNIATRKFNDINVISIDILDLDVNKTYDWVVASGAFNLKDCDDMFTYACTVVDKMIQHAQKGVAFNILTNLPDDLDDETKNIFYVHDSSKWLDYLIRTYTRVALRADYMLGDCTFYIFK